jgi:hypothetical protein
MMAVFSALFPCSATSLAAALPISELPWLKLPGQLADGSRGFHYNQWLIFKVLNKL